MQAAGKHAFHNNLFQLSSDLTQCTQPDHNLAEKVDTILGQCMLHGSSVVTRRRPFWWSQKLHKLCLWKDLLTRQLSSYRNHQDFQPTMLRLIHTYSLGPRTLPHNIHECWRQLTLAIQEIKSLEKQSLAQRSTEQVAKAEIYDSTGSKEKATLLKEIKAAEAASKTFNMFKAIRSTANSASVSHIQIPSNWPDLHTPIETITTLSDPKSFAAQPDPNWRTVLLADKVTYYLLLRNCRHFGQADATPFAQLPLRHSIDWAASTHTADLILEDKNPLDVNSLIQAVLTKCKAQTPLDLISGHITAEEFSGKFCSWRESTSTSPSGCHLGMYKDLFTKFAIPSDADPDAFPIESKTLQADLLSVHLSLLNYCLCFRYTLTRWKEIVNVMIFKDPGDYRIHRLHVIHIYEADFNFILGLKWQQLLHHAEQHKLLHPGQFGSHPGSQANTLTFLEELKTDISYSSRKPLINFDNNAASCYDRIIPSLASLVSRAHGQHCDVCFVHATTLQHACYRLKTTMGVSDNFYHHCNEFPIYGTGQGSGNSPVIWAFISSILFKCHANQAKGALFESPDRSVQITFHMVSFVDDSTGQVNDFAADTPPSLDTLIQLMASDAQLWNNLLHISGGLLKVSKCSYHIIYFDFHPNGKPYMKTGFEGPPLALVDSVASQTLHVKRMLSFTPHKTLGHFKSPNGDGSTHLTYLIDKTVHLATQVASSPATRAQAFLFYWLIYVATIRYSIPQCFYTPTQLDAAQAKSLPAILAKCGYMRSAAYSIIFGPQKYGGAGFIRWSTIQGEGQILLFLKHWRTSDAARKLLQVCLGWAQFQAGTSRPILHNVTTPLPHLESRWLPSLRRFLKLLSAHFDLDRTYVPPLQRQGNQYIMDFVIDSSQFSPAEILLINYCRLYLDVITLSDVTTTCGSQLDPDIKLHTRLNSSLSKYHHPVQQRPNQ